MKLASVVRYRLLAMNSGIDVAVILRKKQRRVSIADEHDYECTQRYCSELNLGGQMRFCVITPDNRPALRPAKRWGGFLFVGADQFTLSFIEGLDGSGPVFLWAKGYDLTIAPRWSRALAAVQLFFNSSYLSAVEDCYSDRTQYLPTAFHDPWPRTLAEVVSDLRNQLFDVRRFDLVFPGSDRHVRPDRYRQRLLNLLARRGLKICVAAPGSVWNRPHADGDVGDNSLDPTIAVLGNWGTERVLRRARCVLDLPWLDTKITSHPSHHDPNGSVFALGWNIFRAGAYGASLLTYDCPATRALGVDENHCLFYQTDISDLHALADEIAERTAEYRRSGHDEGKWALRRLFHATHTYRDRWRHIYREIGRYYSSGSHQGSPAKRETASVASSKPGPPADLGSCTALETRS